MSKPGGTPAAALGQQSFGQSYKSPMQQAAAMALQPKPGFNGGLAQMGAQMLGGGGMNVASALPQIMQMFHPQHAAQQPALGHLGGPDGSYGIGKPASLGASVFGGSNPVLKFGMQRMTR